MMIRASWRDAKTFVVWWSGRVECDIRTVMGGHTHAPNGVSDGGGKPSSWKVHVLVLVLFVAQIITIYTGYEYYTRLDRKYDAKYRDLRQLVRSCESRSRKRRDTSVQDNSVVRPLPSDNSLKMMETEGEPSLKNGSAEIVDEIMNLKPNLTDKAWIWLNDYSRVPVSFGAG